MIYSIHANGALDIVRRGEKLLPWEALRAC